MDQSNMTERRIVAKPVVRNIGMLGVALFLAFRPASSEAADQIPRLIGTWTGENHTISDKKGLKTWKKTIRITSQTDRRFRGYFDYSAGRKEFYGVVYPDNISMTWVASDSVGYNHGRILGPDKIAACYVEPGPEGTAGCAELRRVED